MQHRELVTPDDALLRSIFGVGLPEALPAKYSHESEPERAARLARYRHRAYRARLRRAEDSEILPPRLYLSSARFAYDKAELLEALDRLPRSHAETLRPADSTAPPESPRENGSTSGPRESAGTQEGLGFHEAAPGDTLEEPSAGTPEPAA
jgi:hypothetical protein